MGIFLLIIFLSRAFSWSSFICVFTNEMFFLSKIKDASILWVQLLNLPEHVRIYNIIIIYISTYIEQSFLTYFLPCSCTDLTWMKDVYSNYKCNLAILRSQICISLEINFGISILTRKIKFIMGCTASSIQVKFVEWPDKYKCE